MDEESQQLIERLRTNLGNRAAVTFKAAGPTNKLRCLDGGRLLAQSRVKVECTNLTCTLHTVREATGWAISSFTTDPRNFASQTFQAVVSAIRISGVSTNVVERVIAALD